MFRNGEQAELTQRVERRIVIRVSVEIRGIAACFKADVCAESVVQAVDLADACFPGCEARLLFPIDPDAFFAGDLGTDARVVSPEILEATG